MDFFSFLKNNDIFKIFKNNNNELELGRKQAVVSAESLEKDIIEKKEKLRTLF